ncbi:PTS system mannose/fructose/sorbose family transporter subunit IID [Clostridium polynesiense]|uniref:PTS system mannose/fructose/sorbose family transporter subunit IID n=1 Tax=Clostridium polynesiense TaxID=1325933 RepID=UPI0005906FF3|nr:PTS system mannose/fructose/sorbose family transporter subunit IID [Clostridium polynesiense]
MTNKILTRKDIDKAHLYWYLGGENSNSYERLQALAFCNAMAGGLKKIYADDEEGYREALTRHLEFFNTEMTIGSIIPGIVLALEERKVVEGDVDPDVITSLKLGLMGPIAGIGDSLIWGTIKAILLALAASFGLEGNPVGIIFAALYSILIFGVGRMLCRLGYNLGTNAVNKLLKSGIMNRIITSASVLGLFMMGALSASYVSLKTKISFVMSASGAEIVIQNVLDQILPGILPLGAIFGIIYFFRKKGQNYVVLVFSIIAISLLGSFLGVF